MLDNTGKTALFALELIYCMIWAKLPRLFSEFGRHRKIGQHGLRSHGRVSGLATSGQSDHFLAGQTLGDSIDFPLLDDVHAITDIALLDDALAVFVHLLRIAATRVGRPRAS